MEGVKQQVATPDILSLWAQYLQERRRSLLTELKAVEQQQEQLRAMPGQQVQPRQAVRQQ